MVVPFLLRLGFCRRRDDGTIRWPFAIGPWWHFKCQVRCLLRGQMCVATPIGLFRNLPGVIKWIPGSLLPRRWGFCFFTFEFGQRG